MTELDLWAMLAAPTGYLGVWLYGPRSTAMIPVGEPRRFERVVRGGAYDMEMQVGAATFVDNPSWTDDPMDRRARPAVLPGPSCVLWARAESPKEREAVEHFAPAPTVVLGEGAAQTALWALQQPLSQTWTEQLNKRLAHRLGTKKAHCSPWFSFAPAGAVLRAGRGRPVVVEVASWTGELHGARAVAGNLEDPPDPRAAWKARQAA